jgi:hypothetical protein
MPKNKKILRLTDNEHAGNNLTHLFKSGNITRSSSVSQYSEFSKQIPKIWRGLHLYYDIWYNVDTPDTDTNRLFISSFLYTDMLNKCLYFRVPNNRLNTELLQTILLNNHETTDHSVVSRIANNLADKYNLLLESNQQFYDRVIFLPGSNILEEILDFKKVKELVDHTGAKIKPHPLTTKFHLFLLKKQFGDENILSRDKGAFAYMLNSKVSFCCKNSEMGLSALILGKKIELVDNATYSTSSTYGPIYDTIMNSKRYSPRDALHKLLSSEYSGIIHLEDPNAVEKMYNFLNSYNLLYKVKQQ